ncbi:MAG: hypothetical protein ACOC22_00580 [bacterium]
MGWDVPTTKPTAKPSEPEKKKQEQNTPTITDEQVESWLFDEGEKTSSNVCCALYGFDGTAKSGIALDCRNEEEKQAGKKVIVFDLDGGCMPLKVIYHDNDPNIIIKNPLVRDDEGEIDYEGTFKKIKKTLDYIERNISKMNIKAFVFDGLDKFLKNCELSMRKKFGLEITDGAKFLYWNDRNIKYSSVIEQIKLMDVDRYYITHMKKDENGNMIPDWEKKTPDMMFQRVRCFREVKVEGGEKVTYMKAEIDKCKTNLALEGQIYTIAETRQKVDGETVSKWYGLKFTKDNKIQQNK